ncbi:uncharacterized protein LOC124210553 [Daphnia pulex]|uniref:uncharacterized protein LOC124210553 n=1 Tax=Daphnia pulex TaxID=6669 RepID=UPI001EDFF4BD|nr:uncharacterized protein LOC124210553 [Daphnia pulex]
MKMRRATVNRPVPLSSRHQKICQKDQIQRASSGLYQCDANQLDIADSSEEDEGLQHQFKIGIPGSRTIFGKKNHPLRRIFWICLTIVCCFLAFYQVKGCIIKYESENVIEEVQIINNETLIFPSVTMCNRWNQTFNPSAMEAMRLWNDQIQMPSDLLSLVNVTATWNGIGRGDFKEMELVCWFGRNKSCEASGYWEILHTVVGTCYSFRVRQPVRETGLFNGLYIKIEAKSPFDNWFYYIHPHNVTPALNIHEIRNASNDFLGMGKFNTDVKINYHQAQSLNVRRDPCVEEAEYTTELCELECFSEQLVRHAGCRLPFMKLSNTSPNRNRSICNTTQTYRAAGEELKRMLLSSDGTTWNRTGCNCIMSCFRTYYQTDKEKVMADAKPGLFRFRVFFQTRTYEARTQKLEYGLIHLFCAIGTWSN